jgi:type II secretory pathway component PulJ
MLNGSSWAIRDKCIEVLNRSSKNPKWDNAEENEKYRLEARLRELEHERLAATAAGAAGVFNEQGANASLKKAQGAKDAIRAENVSLRYL